MSYPSALALGIAGREEVMELELAEDHSDTEILERLRAATVPGLGFLRVEHIPQGVKKARLRSNTFEMKLPPERIEQAETQTALLGAAETCPVERLRGGKAVKTVDPCRWLERVEVESGTLRMHLTVPGQGGASPRDVLTALGLQDLENEGCYLTRTRVELES